MKLVELAPVPVFDLPIAQLRDHLRLGTGFADDALQDPLLEAALRGALDAIEARTGKAIFERPFRWTVSAWRSPSVQALPVAPVNSLTGVNVVTLGGDVTPIDMAGLALEEDTHRPQLHALVACLPAIPMRGLAEITFLAGFSATWAGMPSDMALAVLQLAAHFYETRHEGSLHDGNMPLGVCSLIEKHRTVRILGGAGA